MPTSNAFRPFGNMHFRYQKNEAVFGLARGSVSIANFVPPRLPSQHEVWPSRSRPAKQHPGRRPNLPTSEPFLAAGKRGAAGASSRINAYSRMAVWPGKRADMGQASFFVLMSVCSPHFRCGSHIQQPQKPDGPQPRSWRLCFLVIPFFSFLCCGWMQSGTTLDTRPLVRSSANGKCIEHLPVRDV